LHSCCRYDFATAELTDHYPEARRRTPFGELRLPLSQSITEVKSIMRRSAAWLTIVSLLSLVAGCSNSARPLVAEEQPPAYQPTPQSTPIKMAVALAPKLVEVQEAVKRVFKDAVVIDSNYNPNFLAGDFNGDASQDIAVILKPAPDKLEQMNQEFPPWLLRDPRAGKSQRMSLRVEKDEVLLAVIHGYGTNEWRDPEATQTFVLKNVVGKDLRVESGKDFVASNSGRRLPRPLGDLIAETLQGTQGYLYYAAATYSWYDPKTFKGDSAPTRMVHQPRVMRAHAQQKAPAVQTITAEELKTMVAANTPVTIIDVRGSEGYAASSTTIKGALHFKLRRLKARVGHPPLKDLPRDREIVTYCACPRDESSISAAQILQASGFKRVRVLQGGWHEWLKANGPVEPK
jgi:rhodanese-related sulfurtransferase